MSSLPIPGSVYFKDFSHDLVVYQIMRCNEVVSELEGLPNMEDGDSFIHFQYGADILIGDILINNSSRHTVTKTRIDTYLGNPELLAVFIR